EPQQPSKPVEEKKTLTQIAEEVSVELEDCSSVSVEVKPNDNLATETLYFQHEAQGNLLKLKKVSH
ncbi:hypothetical protein O6163_25240, partial [Salmonella enterica subsp. enterica]